MTTGRRGRRSLAAALAGAALLAAGCGAPEELDRGEGRALLQAREDLDDALDLSEAARTDPRVARTLSRRVQRFAQAGAADRLEELAPALVKPGGGVDQAAVADFVRYAEEDAPRALLGPATAAVEAMVSVIDDSGADEDTRLPADGDRRLGDFVAEVEGDIRNPWPELAEDLTGAL